MERAPFTEYLRELEPDKALRGYAWYTAIGLQAVDGLQTSDYLVRTVIQNIEGAITIKEAPRLIQTYYDAKPSNDEDGERIEEADKVSSRIAAILLQKRFRFLPEQYLEIHQYLFEGDLPVCGKNQRLQYFEKRMGSRWRVGSLRKFAKSAGNFGI